MSAPSTITSLYEWLCATLGACPTLMDLLDAENPIRRMQMGIERPWENVLTYGRATRRRMDPGSNRPLYTMTVVFEPWCRGEAMRGMAGDLILADIEHQLMRIFEYNQQFTTDCTQFALLRAGFDDFSTEPTFNDAVQGWTQEHRFRFDISVPTCRPVLAGCGEC